MTGSRGDLGSGRHLLLRRLTILVAATHTSLRPSRRSPRATHLLQVRLLLLFAPPVGNAHGTGRGGTRPARVAVRCHWMACEAWVVSGSCGSAGSEAAIDAITILLTHALPVCERMKTLRLYDVLTHSRLARALSLSRALSRALSRLARARSRSRPRPRCSRLNALALTRRWVARH